MKTESGQGGVFERFKRSHLLVRVAIVLLMLVAGLMIGVGGFTTAVEATNSLEFCTSCHSMSYNYAEYKESLHYSNKSGVRAVCSDCHVPKKNWYSEMYRKLIAAQDVWAEITGDFSTREKFDAQRGEMAKREWARMKESNSIGCRNCHSLAAMDLAEQDKGAQSKHAEAEAAGKTCIDCHKGVVHKLPRIH
ncbi:MAG: NapC/NirT family cytochrome c [Nitrosomonadales bacterium]|nr:NapC/NirT family cytochrome c [Nitrosomonadales bacterium]